MLAHEYEEDSAVRNTAGKCGNVFETMATCWLLDLDGDGIRHARASWR